MIDILPQDTEQFLKLLFDPDDNITIGRRGPGSNKKAKWYGAIALTLNGHLSSYIPWQLQDETQQLLVGPLPRKRFFKTSPGKTKDIAPGRVAWTDIDFQDQHGTTEEEILKDLQSLSVPPSIIVHSGHGFHCYWLLDQRYTPEEIESVNKGFKQKLQQFVIDNHANPAFLMRLPGSWNLKEIDPTSYTLEEIRAKRKLCRIVECHPDRQYTLHSLPQYEKHQPKRARPTQKKKPSPAPHPAVSYDPGTVAFRNMELLYLIEHLPTKVQRMLALGERKETQTGQTIAADEDRSELVFHTVQQLIAYGWTDTQIHDLLLSDLPLTAVEKLQEKYGEAAQAELTREISKIRSGEEFKGHLYPRLVDDAWLRADRKQVSITLPPNSSFPTPLLALKRLAAFAQQLYEHSQPGQYLAALPMGIGKTVHFMLPFVAQCIRLHPTKGIIVAVERMEDALKYAEWINQTVQQSVAFGLVGHHPVSCPLAKDGKAYNKSQCSSYHQDYAAKAYQYPILFLTHTMLSRKGNQPYRTWKAGERVLCIIDEKPSAWWMKEGLTNEDLQQLTKTPIDPAIIAKAGQLLTKSPNTFVKLKVTPKQRQELRTLIATGGETENETERVVRSLTALYSLTSTPGLVVDVNGTKELILTQRLPLPTLPTLILDGTGLLDPEYPSDVNILSVNPW